MLRGAMELLLSLVYVKRRRFTSSGGSKPGRITYFEDSSTVRKASPLYLFGASKPGRITYFEESSTYVKRPRFTSSETISIFAFLYYNKGEKGRTPAAGKFQDDSWQDQKTA